LSKDVAEALRIAGIKGLQRSAMTVVPSAWDFSRSAASREDSIRSAELAHYRIPMVYSWQDFSRLSPRLSAAKISHNSNFLMKS
jgi:hypothetical protein